MCACAYTRMWECARLCVLVSARACMCAHGLTYWTNQSKIHHSFQYLRSSVYIHLLLMLVILLLLLLPLRLHSLSLLGQLLLLFLGSLLRRTTNSGFGVRAAPTSSSPRKNHHQRVWRQSRAKEQQSSEEPPRACLAHWTSMQSLDVNAISWHPYI